MGVDIFQDILYEFLNGFINFSNELKEYTQDAVDITADYLNYTDVFNCMEYFGKALNVDLNKLIMVIFSSALILLTLKIVWKLFDVYMIGGSGDEDMDPLIVLTNFIKAIFLCGAFGVLFQYMSNFGKELTDKILQSLRVNDITLTSVLGSYMQDRISLFFLSLLFIYAICALVLNIKFLINGVQLFILRISISFATVGILDSDGGVFKPYIKKFFQIGFAVVLQVACYKLSLVAMSGAHVLIGVAFLVFSMSAPAFLSEFIMTNQGGGNKLQQALYSVSIIRSFTR